MEHLSHAWRPRIGHRLALLACAACAWSAVRAGEVQKLAVVNVSLVFEKYLLVQDVQKRIDATHEARKKELEVRGKELADGNRQLEEQYKQMGNSEQVFDAVQRLRKAQWAYERDVNQLNEQIQKDYTREMRAVLSDIRQAIRMISEARHLDMVLRSPDTDDPKIIKTDAAKMSDPAEKEKATFIALTEPQTVSEVLERFHRNPVLFGADTTDITKEVLDSLNAAFMKRSVGGAKQ